MIVDDTTGREYETSAYNYSFAATALAPSSTEGAVPTMSATLGPDNNSMAFMSLYRKPILLEDFNVSSKFHASEPTDTDGIMSIAGLSDLENLNIDLIWPANHWDFFGAIGFLTKNVRGVEPIAVDSFTWDELAWVNYGWVMPAVVGNGWVMLKQYLSANGLTFFEYDWWAHTNAIKLNTMYDAFDLDKANIISSTVTLDTTDPADVVNIKRYEYTDYLSAFTEATPRFQTEQESYLTIEAGQVETFQVQTDFSMTKLDTNRPRCVDDVWASITYYTSVYSVIGNDDLMITAAQWKAFDGDMWVEINKDDPTVLDVTITGAHLDSLSPFKIAISSGGGRYHTTLHMFARGVEKREYPFTTHTGVVRGVQSEDETEVDNPFLCRMDLIPNAAFRSARVAAGFGWTMSFSVPPHQGVMKANDRVKHKGHWWRIDSVTISQDSVTYNCTEATEISHLNEAYEGMTIADFNAKFEGTDMVEFAAVMLGG